MEARDLREGDVLAARNSEGLTITGLRSRQESARVYCLEIERYHNCAVNRAGILVHNGGKKEATTAAAGEEGSPVTVYGTVKLEHYEISILGASAASPLLDWLKSNGYRVVPTAGKVLDAYIHENWAFVAVKLNPSEKRYYQNEFLPPLTIKYSHDRLVFPLRISSVSTNQTAKIRLYVIAESTVSSSNMLTATLAYTKSIPSWLNLKTYIEDCILQTAGNEQSGLVVLWKGKYPASLDLQEILGELMKNPFLSGAKTYLTRLETRMGPSVMTRDIELMPDAAPRLFRVDITSSETLTATPWRVPGIYGVTAIAAGDYHTVALKTDDTIWTWGSNLCGQLGDGSTTDRHTPVKVGGISGVIAIAAGWRRTAALKMDGTLWGWGSYW